jgi:hypothetical protein
MHSRHALDQPLRRWGDGLKWARSRGFHSPQAEHCFTSGGHVVCVVIGCPYAGEIISAKRAALRRA